MNRLKQLFEKHDGFWSAVTKRTVFIIHTITQQSDVCFSNQQPALQHLDIQPLRNSDEKVRKQTSCSPASYTNQPIRTSHTDQPIGRDLQPAMQSAAFYERWRIQHSPPAVAGVPASMPLTNQQPVPGHMTLWVPVVLNRWAPVCLPNNRKSWSFHKLLPILCSFFIASLTLMIWIYSCLSSSLWLIFQVSSVGWNVGSVMSNTVQGMFCIYILSRFMIVLFGLYLCFCSVFFNISCSICLVQYYLYLFLVVVFSLYYVGSV